MIAAAAQKVDELLRILRVDVENDHNTRETPERVARMLVNEIMSGRFTRPPALTEFDNVTAASELIVTGPLAVRSMCAHHFMPIRGKAYVGILPGGSRGVVGLSKYDRVVEYFAARLQIQEELTHQIGQYLMEETEPAGVAVRISAVHMCKTHRGVRGDDDSRMITTAFFGSFDGRSDAKAQFLQECALLAAPLR